jgi:hypothetical protein
MRWLAVSVGVALLVGSGLGFGVGSRLTPSGGAERGLKGVGFLPANGWTILQTGERGPGSGATAIAANVPIDRADHNRGIPRETLARLPARGIVVVAKFSPRGDPAVDLTFPVRSLPLRLVDAQRVPATPLPNVAEYRLRAAAGGFNFDFAIYFGRPDPTPVAQGAAQRQLSRLAVGTAGVTIFARPTVVEGYPGRVDLFGSVESGRAGEDVTIQTKDCGSDDFRVVAGTMTHEGGGWFYPFYPGVSTSVRAVWKDAASGQISVRQRARIWLSKRPSRRLFFVSVEAKKSFWRKKVLIQARRSGKWSTVKTVILTETHSQGGYYASSGAGAEFSVSLPKGTLIRAVITLAESRPCYLAGVSPTRRT